MTFWLQWTITSLSFIILGLILYFGGLNFILLYDPTYISFSILLIFSYATLRISRLTFLHRANSIDAAEWHFIDYCRWACTRLGLLGTVIGLIFMLSVFGQLDIENIQALKASLISISAGMGTALLTTAVGTTASIVLTGQQVIATWAKERKNEINTASKW